MSSQLTVSGGFCYCCGGNMRVPFTQPATIDIGIGLYTGTDTMGDQEESSSFANAYCICTNHQPATVNIFHD